MNIDFSILQLLLENYENVKSKFEDFKKNLWPSAQVPDPFVTFKASMLTFFQGHEIELVVRFPEIIAQQGEEHTKNFYKKPNGPPVPVFGLIFKDGREFQFWGSTGENLNQARTLFTEQKYNDALNAINTAFIDPAYPRMFEDYLIKVLCEVMLVKSSVFGTLKRMNQEYPDHEKSKYFGLISSRIFTTPRQLICNSCGSRFTEIPSQFFSFCPDCGSKEITQSHLDEERTSHGSVPPPLSPPMIPTSFKELLESIKKKYLKFKTECWSMGKGPLPLMEFFASYQKQIQVISLFPEAIGNKGKDFIRAYYTGANAPQLLTFGLLQLDDKRIKIKQLLILRDSVLRLLIISE